MLGIGLKVSAVGVFILMSSMLKASGDVPAGEMVFFRSLFAIPPVLLFLAWRRELSGALVTANPMGHLKRGLAGAMSMGCTFFALTRLPLPEWVAIGYAMPIFIVILSAVVLKEAVGIYRWSAVTAGLVGVLVIMWPRLTAFSGGIEAADSAAIGAVVALAAAVFGATAQIQIRNLVVTERSATVVIYFSLACTLLGLLTLPFGWVWPTPQQAALLIGAGLVGGLGQILLTECYRYGDMSVIAPFEYSSLLLSLAIGYFVFSEVPTVEAMIGSLIVIGAGIVIILRERHTGRERDRARAVDAR